MLSLFSEQGGRGDFGPKGSPGTKGEKGEIVSTLLMPLTASGVAKVGGPTSITQLSTSTEEELEGRKYR